MKLRHIFRSPNMAFAPEKVRGAIITFRLDGIQAGSEAELEELCLVLEDLCGWKSHAATQVLVEVTLDDLKELAGVESDLDLIRLLASLQEEGEEEENWSE